MITENVDPYTLDWGVATPEGYNKELNQLLHVFNFDMSSHENVRRCTIFVIGRIRWFSIHAPLGASHKLVFDLRGQAMTLLDRATKMKEEIMQDLKGTALLIDILI